ncbi:Transketolase [Venturia nashicola]|uniref:Transketolase n=1 Tax=Venturia nashicola TaxID=86259 RepID=A0A4Z1P4T2_9PEZI|nr:Transketolase [Venturia nashicola]TLD29774.1 Transketolase [Venturia nashicola]
MAAADVLRIMNPDSNHHHVHPFFRKPDPLKEENEDAASVAQDVAALAETGAGKRKKRNEAKANISKQPSLLAFVRLEKAALPAETTEPAIPNGSLTHIRPQEEPTLEPDTHIRPQEEPPLEPHTHIRPQEEPTLEPDPNYERRKRRKTGSPASETERPSESNPGAGIQHENAPLPWHEQLLVEAAKVEHDSADLDTNSPPIDSHDSTKTPKTVSFLPSTISRETAVESNGPPDQSMVSITGTGVTETAGVEMAEQARRASEETQEDPVKLPAKTNGRVLRTPRPRTPSPNTNTRLVRMIQLKGGKLASPPKPKSKPEPEKVEIKRKTRARGKQTKQLFVTITYGNSDEGKSIGEKINRILDGEERVEIKVVDPIIPTKIITPKKVSPKKPSGPPKPTHPFFSGKPLPKPVQDYVVVSKDAIGDHAADALPRKSSATTPGKIRAEAQAHRVARSVTGFSLSMSAPHNKRSSGTREAPWPSEGIVHSRGYISECPVSHCDLVASGFQEGHFKRKQASVVVPDAEDLVRQHSKWLTPHGDRSVLRIPERVIITGVRLQKLISAELHTSLKASSAADSDSEDDVVIRKQQPQHAPHSALSNMYAAIKNSLTPFDRFECETQAWTQKHAPKCAEEVLQSGKEALILRDWLKNSTISAVEKGSNRSTTGSQSLSTKSKSKLEKKKKRKRPDDLDDFLVESEDELAAPAELEALEDESFDGPRDPQNCSLVRGGAQGVRGVVKSCNAVLISGSHGCGKTAAVYAVAKELGFEVFELNSGSRRSGKDVLEKVGDMTENHLVQQVSKALSEKTDARSEKLISIEIVPDDTPDIKQGSMTSFFKPAAQKKKSAPKNMPVTVGAAKLSDKEARKDQSRQEQKQSLILLEEVDVLFDEDKQFWLTVFALAAHSKRPIIMTCTNENLVPLDSLSLHAILRFTAPPVDLAVDYLLLTAAYEGHLLERAAVKSLFTSNSNDIRASVTNLDFWCQIGVGDSAGGFNWMIDRYPPGVDVDKHGNTLRVVSKHTYTNDTGLISQDLLGANSCNGAEYIESLLAAAWTEWRLRPGDLLPQIEHDRATKLSPQSGISHLQAMDFLAECTSAADVYCGFDMREAYQQPLDTTSPEISDKARSNYTVGFPWTLVQADSVASYANMDTKLAITNQFLTHRIHSSLHDSDDTDSIPNKSESIEQNLITAIQTHCSPGQAPCRLTRADFSAALDPLAETRSTSLTAPNTMTASSLDREFSIVVTDIAPYVRSIAAHDLMIEQQRMKVSNLLSAGGGAKKMRMTRASRSAVEGGSRQTARRERWFDKSLNLGLVLRTAGKGWGDVLTARRSGDVKSVESLGEGSVGSERERSAEQDVVMVRNGKIGGGEDAIDERA